MNRRPDDFNALVAGYLAGDLTGDQRRCLLSAIQDSSELETDFLRELDIHGALRIIAQESVDGAGRETGSDAFVDELLEKHRRQTVQGGQDPDLEDDAPDFDPHELPRPIPMPRHRSNSMWAVGMALAACLVLGVLLIFATRHQPMGSKVAGENPQSPTPVPAPVPQSPALKGEPKSSAATQVVEQTPRPAPVPPPLASVPQPPATVVKHDPIPKPAPKTPSPAAPEPAIIAHLEFAHRGVSVFRDGKKIMPAKGMALHASDLIVTGSPQGEEAMAATLRYPDQTHVALTSDTEVQFDVEDGAKRVTLRTGRLICDVSKQPTGQSMLLSTAHAKSIVLGTQFVLEADLRRTRLEVNEGRVRIDSLDQKHSLTIAAGFFTEIGDEIAQPLIRPLPALAVDDVLLLPLDGKAVGKSWKLVDDAGARGGSAWQSAPLRSEDFKPTNHWVEFEFDADADRPYWVWVRGRCLIPGTDVKARNHSDFVLLEVTSGGKFTLVDSKGNKDPRHRFAENMGVLNGWANRQGDWWLGGNEDPDIANRVAVTFARSGPQKIRMRLQEGPVQISGIWLSTTQADRPGVDWYPNVNSNK